MRACMQVVVRAVLTARSEAWGSHVNPDRLADLMDAIHNIPILVQHWETCDQDLLKEMLMAYESKWKEGPPLREIYEQAMAANSE